MTMAALTFAAGVGVVRAVEPADFGVAAIQRATVSYSAGDTAGARRQVNDAAAGLVTKSGSMKSPGSGEVLMLVNDLLLLPIAPGTGNVVTLEALGAAERRAGELERRYPDGVGTPLNTRQ